METVRTLWIMTLAWGALPLLPLALVASYRLGRRRRRDEVVIALMNDDAFIRDMGALDRARDRIKEMNTRYATWRREQARATEADAAVETAGASVGVAHE